MVLLQTDVQHMAIYSLARVASVASKRGIGLNFTLSVGREETLVLIPGTGASLGPVFDKVFTITTQQVIMDPSINEFHSSPDRFSPTPGSGSIVEAAVAIESPLHGEWLDPDVVEGGPNHVGLIQGEHPVIEGQSFTQVASDNIACRHVQVFKLGSPRVPDFPYRTTQEQGQQGICCVHREEEEWNKTSDDRPHGVSNKKVCFQRVENL